MDPKVLDKKDVFGDRFCQVLSPWRLQGVLSIPPTQYVKRNAIRPKAHGIGYCCSCQLCPSPQM